MAMAAMDSLGNVDPTGVISATTAAVRLVGTVLNVGGQVKGAIDKRNGQRNGIPGAAPQQDVQGITSAGLTPEGLARAARIDDEAQRRAYEKVNMVLKILGDRMIKSGLVDIQALAAALTQATAHIEVRLFSTETNKLFQSLAQKLNDAALVNSVFTSIYLLGFFASELQSSLPGWKDTYVPLSQRIIQQLFKTALGLDGFKENLSANLDAYKTLATTAGLLKPTDIEYKIFKDFPSFSPCRYSNKSYTARLNNKSAYEKLTRHFEQYGFPQPWQGRDVGPITDWRFLCSNANSRAYEVEKADKNIGEYFGKVLYWLICGANRMPAGMAVIAYYEQHTQLVKWLGPRFGYRIIDASTDLNVGGPHAQMPRKLREIFDSWVLIMPSMTILAQRAQEGAPDQLAPALPTDTSQMTSAERMMLYQRTGSASPPSVPAPRSISGSELSSTTGASAYQRPDKQYERTETSSDMPAIASVIQSQSPQSLYASQIRRVNALENDAASSIVAFDTQQHGEPSSVLPELNDQSDLRSRQSYPGQASTVSSRPQPMTLPVRQAPLSMDELPGNNTPHIQRHQSSTYPSSSFPQIIPESSQPYHRSSVSGSQNFVSELYGSPGHTEQATIQPQVGPQQHVDLQHMHHTSQNPPPAYSQISSGIGNTENPSPTQSPQSAGPDIKIHPHQTSEPSSESHIPRPPVKPRKRAPPPPRVVLATAIYDYEPDEDDEEGFPFKAGDEIEIIEKNKQLAEDGWCRARVKGTKRLGLAPIDYLEEIPGQKPLPSNAPPSSTGPSGHIPPTSTQPPSAQTSNQAHVHLTNSENHNSLLNIGHVGFGSAQKPSHVAPNNVYSPPPHSHGNHQVGQQFSYHPAADPYFLSVTQNPNIPNRHGNGKIDPNVKLAAGANILGGALPAAATLVAAGIGSGGNSGGANDPASSSRPAHPYDTQQQTTYASENTSTAAQNNSGQQDMYNQQDTTNQQSQLPVDYQQSYDQQAQYDPYASQQSYSTGATDQGVLTNTDPTTGITSSYPISDPAASASPLASLSSPPPQQDPTAVSPLASLAPQPAPTADNSYYATTTTETTAVDSGASPLAGMATNESLMVTETTTTTTAIETGGAGGGYEVSYTETDTAVGEASASGGGGLFEGLSSAFNGGGEEYSFGF